MTRQWNFTLTAANVWYNLWNDLIAKDPTFTDPYFGFAPFVPSMVCEYKYQNQALGASFFRSDAKKETGFALTTGSWDVDRSSVNSINLKGEYWSTDTAGSVLYVKVTAI